MTKGDRDKLRAELAGKFVAAIILCDNWRDVIEIQNCTAEAMVAKGAVKYADALMAELGIKVEE